jgi:class 3 adenylate cyclase
VGEIMSTSVRFPLVRKLGLAMAAIAAVPLVGTGLYVVDVNRTAVRELTQHLTGLVADELARSIDGELVGVEDALEGIGRVLTDPHLDPEVTERLALARLSSESALDHLSIHRADGTLLAVMSESDAETGSVRPPEVLPPALRAAADTHDAASGGVQRTPAGPGLLVVVPLRAENAEVVTGYVASVVVLTELGARVRDLRERHFSGVDGALAITDDEGRVLASSDPRLAEPDARPALFDSIDPHVEASWSGRFTDAGREFLGEVRHVPGRALRVTVAVPVEVAFASLARMQWAVGIAVLVAIVLAVLAAVVVARGLTSPMRRLVELAGHLGARRWNTDVVVRTSDELGLVGDALRGAARDLTASEAQIQKEIAIRTDLGRYVAPQIVERVVRREQDMGLGGTRRRITVLFADVVGFTPLTNKLDPETTVGILNELFTLLTEIVFRHDGTVDKFIGDSIMAIYGAPIDQEDHAARALRTAEDMLRFLETQNALWQDKYNVTIHLAIGINTGEAVVGNVGSESRLEYTAIGDTVNVAARLEAIARPQQILITQAVKDAAGDGFEFFDGGERELPGRAGLVHLWEVGV